MTKCIFTIPPDENFVVRLAEGLWKQAKGDPLVLADMLVLLPTRRACRHLREAFLQIPKAKTALLPRMQPLGDLDEAELYFAGSGDLDPAIPPAISPLRRQMLLAPLVQAADREMPLDQAMQLAAALGELLDQVQVERLDVSRLDQLVEGDLAEHWKQTVEFLKIVTAAWPKVLAAEGAIDPAARRNHVIEAQAKVWQKQPPKHPVIAAGSTGSLPATADLLDVVAGLPHGTVVLPGLDCELDEAAWQEAEETHPQFGMKQLLEKFGVARSAVKLWPGCGKSQPRVRLLQEAMRPAKLTEAWRSLKPSDFPKTALKNIMRLTLDTAEEEAQAIALLLREALETPEKTATLVTADRNLAERVAASLRRWEIEVNDSAGASLAVAPIGSFLAALLAAAKSRTSIDYLTLLKHPFAACGLDPATCRIKARAAEIAIWRNPDFRLEETKDIRAWIAGFEKSFEALRKAWKKPLPLEARIKSHIELAEKLAASDRELGARRLWKDEAGEKASEWLAQWENEASDFPPLDGDNYMNLFAALLRTVTVRPNWQTHPRLSILGPLEARLTQADLTILGGLNEGSWPPEPAVDPWMSRPMKKKFGLPLPERRIGFAAHDFIQLASGPDVVLTRARRAGNAPAVPSRFLLQLETVCAALGYHDKHCDAFAPEKPWAEWARMLDRPDAVKPYEAPAPKPPTAARPRKLSVTEIGLWQRNPYAIYARRILDLKKLEPLEIEATAADRGLMIHKALEIFLTRYRDQLPKDADKELLKIGHEIFAAAEKPDVMAFWWPRFRRIAEWFVATEHMRRAGGIQPLAAEAKGSAALKGDFTLTGRADRIDRMPDGSLAIVDYKTGGIPKQNEVKSGLEPQLPLLTLIAAMGGFANIPASKTGEIAYWKLGGGEEPGKIQVISESVDTLTTAAREGLEALIILFADPNTPYLASPRPGLAPRFDDYAHLARLKEWGRITAESEEA